MSKSLCGQLSEVAAQLLSEDKYPCSNHQSPTDGSCILKEETRPLTKREEAMGWSRRPFDHYNPDRMCLACRVYWFVSMASNAAHRMEVLE